MRLLGRLRRRSYIFTLVLVGLLVSAYFLVPRGLDENRLGTTDKYEINEEPGIDIDDSELPIIKVSALKRKMPPKEKYLDKVKLGASHKHPRDADVLSLKNRALKKEAYMQKLTDSHNERRRYLEDAQNNMGRDIPKEALYRDNSDPLSQLKGQKSGPLNQVWDHDTADNVLSDSRQSPWNPQRAIPKPLHEAEGQDPNQRRLLENPGFNSDTVSERNQRFVLKKANKLRGPGIERIRQRLQGREETDDSMNHLPNLDSFDVEAYLAPQRLLKGQGDSMKRFQFNQVASDATPPDRSLRDVRLPSCQVSMDQYPNELPTTSVIICFHDEARSALLRTIVSVLNRSPEELVEEIILVDDASKDPDDGGLLTDIPKIKLVRLDERQGLIRARVRGATVATGEVLTFLDSHCEVTTGWLEPLLSRIQMNYTHLVSPIIDIINKDNMMYTTASPTVKGGFGDNLHFKWETMGQAELRARKSAIEPIRTPAIAGGLFAIDRQYFIDMGMYDTEMEIWGGENIELSLRVWMCGGTMEIIPCSHVGHIFRSAMPYDFGPGGNYHNTVGKNIRRTVEVWLDKYKTYYYEKNVYSKDIPFGDVSDRVALREKLQCKSFSWYIKNVYPQFQAPPVQDFTYGQLRQRDLCLDTLGRHSMQSPEMRSCMEPGYGGKLGNQGWALTTKGGIKHHSLCLTNEVGNLYLGVCDGDSKQQFQHTSDGLVIHTASGLCMTLDSRQAGPVLVACEESDIWEFVFLS